MQVRDATLADAPAIGEAHAEAWLVGFAGLFAPDWLQNAAQERRHRWTQTLPDNLVGASDLLVAETNQRVIGFVHFGPSEELAAVGEVFGLYVHPDHWGSGAARMLSQHAHERLAAQGFEQIVLWTLAGAGRARGFYDHNGWALTGRTSQRDFGDGRPIEVIEYSLRA